MTTFYIEKDGTIVLHDTDLKRLQDTLTFMPQFAGLDIQETDGFIVNGEIVSAEAFAEMERQKEQQALMEQKKALRTEAVSKITVTVDGMEFDGDEIAQDRMARAITMFQANNLPADYQTDWVLADNTIAKVTVAQLSQALLLAGQAQTALWTVPYQNEETNAGNE